jgi:hypothetical protein
MSSESRVYLALGDSMSIDLYTGVEGGGAVNQFFAWFRWLHQPWTLVDKSANMCQMRNVPANERGDLITLTIGGNDLLFEQEVYLRDGLGGFAREHLDLLSRLRAASPEGFLIVGNIYSPQTPLEGRLAEALDEANAMIAANVETVGGHLADIRAAFHGKEQELLCYDIEPSLKGATVIAGLFKEVVVRAGGL